MATRIPPTTRLTVRAIRESPWVGVIDGPAPRLPLDYQITAAGHRRHRGAEHSGGWGIGAGDGTRTRDNLLGRQELYQLSYSRAGAEGET